MNSLLPSRHQLILAKRRSRLLVAILLCLSMLVPGAASVQEKNEVDQAPERSPDGSNDLQVVATEVALASGWTLPPEVVGEQANDQAGAALARPSLVGASLDLSNAPEMVILDTNGHSGVFAIRSKNEGHWSSWVTVEADNQDAPDGLSGEEGVVPEGTAVFNGAIGPIWIGEHSEAVEIIQLDGDIESLTVEALTSTADQEPDLLPARIEAAEPGARPTIQPRSAWASEGWEFGNEHCDDGPSYADNVRAVVVHHTVTTNTYNQNQVDDLLRGIYRTHVKINGWCDVGYNFVVDKFGTIWEARSGGAERPVIGGHAKGFNTWSAGVALLGQHQAGARPTAIAPSAASLNSIAALASWKLGLHGIDPFGTTWMKSRTGATSGLRYPDGTWVEVPSILGHRDLGLTSCPGSHAYSRLGTVRSGAIRDSVLPYLPAAHEPQLSGPAFLTVDDVGGIRAGGAADYLANPPTPTGAVLAISAEAGRGFVLQQDGTVIGFGGATSPGFKPAGTRTVIDLVVSNGGNAGYVMDENGGLHPFNGAASLTVATATIGQAVAFGVAANGKGYVLDMAGNLSPIGSNQNDSMLLSGAPVDIGVLPDGESGWVLDQAGRLYPFGGAPDWQRRGGNWNGTARAIAVDPNGNGGWILDSEGRLDGFGPERLAAPLSTTIGLATAVDIAVWWELRPELAESKAAQYADGLTQLFLGRSNDLRQLDRAVWKADYHGFGPFIDDLATSDEWAGQIVDEIYQGVLGRPAEEEGRQYWIGQLRDGLRTQDLGALFYSSPEYVIAAGSSEGYVTQLYQALLHRQPDAEGLDYWVSRLENGSARPIGISSGFYSSEESRNDRVAGLYATILDREPDPEGLVYWSDLLLVSDDIELAKNLAGSKEFFLRVVDED